MAQYYVQETLYQWLVTSITTPNFWSLLKQVVEPNPFCLQNNLNTHPSKVKGGTPTSYRGTQPGQSWQTDFTVMPCGEGNGNHTPVLLPGESHRRRSLVGCSPWGHRVGHDWATSLSLSWVQGNFQIFAGFDWHLWLDSWPKPRLPQRFLRPWSRK